MHPREYEVMVKDFLDAVYVKAMKKLKEYGSDTDALESIKLQAQAEGRTPESQALSLEGKHNMSLARYVAALDKGGDWMVLTKDWTEGLNDKLLDRGVYNAIQHVLFHVRSKGKS